jgi:putative phage-type endonuclease
MNEWLKWRAQGVGSSDAAVIMKKFPYGKTPRMLYDEKINLTSEEETPAMRHGKEHEEPALKWLEDRMGYTFERQVQREHRQHGWMRATLDGINPAKRMLAEIKCPWNLKRHSQTKQEGIIPEIYWPQLQHQLEVCDLDDAIFVSYNYREPEDSLIIEVKRDPSYTEKLLEEENEFWSAVLSFNPPPLTELDYRERGADWVSIATQKYTLSQKIKELKKEEDALQEALVTMSLGESSRAEGIFFTKYEEKGRVDYDALLTYLGLSSEFVNSFRKNPPTKWRLSVK